MKSRIALHVFGAGLLVLSLCSGCGQSAAPANTPAKDSRTPAANETKEEPVKTAPGAVRVYEMQVSGMT